MEKDLLNVIYEKRHLVPNANKMATSSVRDQLANRLLELDGIIEARNVARISEEDTIEFVKQMKNPKTVIKTRCDVKKAKEWLMSIGDGRELFEIPPEELNIALSKMFLELKKRDQSEYEPDSIKSFQLSLQRHLSENDYGHCITKDDVFKHSRDVLFSKKKALKQEGLGNKKRRSDPFTDDEIGILKEKALLGDGNPEAIINTMWFNNTIHFGLRGRQEHQSMLWGDVELTQTSSGREFLVFTERATKTRNGADSDPRQFQPKMFAQPGDPFCPVQMYKSYATKRPEKMNSSASKFYLGKNYRHRDNAGESWFVNLPLGINSLGLIAKTMSEKAGLSGKHTNHSGRKTSITKLLDANVPPTEVAQLSGHKNLMSLNSYNTVNIDKQLQMSTILHRVSSDGDNVRRTTVEENVRTTSTNAGINMSDEELIAASQEIESALDVIQCFEQNQNLPFNNQIVDIPVQQQADGSLCVLPNNAGFNPESLFRNCTFNNAVNVIFK